MLDRVGKGRVALLLSDQIWLWSRGHEGGGPQAELLRRIAHWLMQEPELEENALTARVADGPPDDRAPLHRSGAAGPGDGDRSGRQDADAEPDARPRPGRATASLPAATPGVWQASDGTRTAYAAAGAANPPELADLRATGDAAAQAGRGPRAAACTSSAPARRRAATCRTCGAPSRTGRPPGSSWIGLERRHDHVVTGIAALALLPAWVALPLMLGLLVLAWRREGT